MKRLPTTLALLAALAGSAAAAPYVLPSPQYGAYTPYDWQPAYGLEGLYGIAQHSDMPDTYGLRGSLNIYSAQSDSLRHQININVAATWGSDDTNLSTFLPESPTLQPSGQRADYDLFLLPVTLGYNINIRLVGNAELYLGGKAGYAWNHSKLSGTATLRDGTRRAVSDSASGGGFTFSVGGGLKFRCSETTLLHVGYEFGRSKLGDPFEGKDLTYGAHTILLGISGQF